MKIRAQGGPSQNSRSEMKLRKNHEKCSPINNDTSTQNCCFVENLFFYLYYISCCTRLLSFVTAHPPPRFSDLYNGSNFEGAFDPTVTKDILYQVRYIMLMQNIIFVLLWIVALRRPSVSFRTFGRGASWPAIGSLRSMSESPPSSVAALGALNVA